MGGTHHRNELQASTGRAASIQGSSTTAVIKDCNSIHGVKTTFVVSTESNIEKLTVRCRPGSPPRTSAPVRYQIVADRGSRSIMLTVCLHDRMAGIA